jgi:hypothetical protein
MAMPNFHMLDLTDHEVNMLEDAFKAISSMSSWEFMKTFEPKEGEGFLLTPSLFTANERLAAKEKEFQDAVVKAEEVANSANNMCYALGAEKSLQELLETIEESKTTSDRVVEATATISRLLKEVKEAKEQVVISAKLDAINAKMEIGHSGSSYAWVMRCMELLAKKGWEELAADIGPKQEKHPPSIHPPCHCRAAEGYTSGWCGVASWGIPGCEY